MPAARRPRTRSLRKALHLGHHIGVVRGALHGARLALHVHQAHARSSLAAAASSAPGARSARTSLIRCGAGGAGARA